MDNFKVPHQNLCRGNEDVFLVQCKRLVVIPQFLIIFFWGGRGSTEGIHFENPRCEPRVQVIAQPCFQPSN